MYHIYTVTACNHFGDITAEWNFLEKKLAVDTFNAAVKCEDCASASIMSALTGELFMTYDYHMEIKSYW